MQVKGHSAFRLKWQVMTLATLIVSVLAVTTEEQVSCTYTVTQDSSCDDNYRQYQEEVSGDAECRQCCNNDKSCVVAVYQDPLCLIYHDDLEPLEDEGWVHMRKSCPSNK